MYAQVAGAIDLTEDFDHGGGGPGGFDAAVHVLTEAAVGGLLFVFDEEDFVDDGNEGLESDLLETIGDALCDELGMSGFTFHDDAEGDDDRGGIEGDEGLDGDRNFEGAGDTDEIDTGLGEEFAEFIDDGIDEGVGVAFVILGRNDGESDAFATKHAGFRWECQRHGGGMECGVGVVNASRLGRTQREWPSLVRFVSK